MRKIISLFLLIILAGLTIISCSKKDAQSLQNNGGNNTNCDTANMTYSTHVKPILQNECTSCHAASNASGGIILDTYNGAKIVAENGKLIGAISHANGFIPMPLGRSKLSNCNINTISAWVNLPK